MSSAIRTVLAACELPEDDDVAWDRLIMVNNIGDIPCDRAAADVLATRGFNVLVLDEHGAAKYFCKCRPARAGWSAHSTLAHRLSRVPDLATVLPRTWAVHTDALDAEVSRYIAGEVFEALVRSMRSADLAGALRAILSSADAVSLHAARIAPELLGTPRDVDLHAVEPWIIEQIVAAGIHPNAAAVLADVMDAAGRVTRTLQHGDLWPRNVIRADGGWRILDLESYGTVEVPLYDALHLVRTSWDGRRRHGGGIAWVDAMRDRSPDSAMFRSIVRREIERAALTPAQVGGVLTYYVLDIAARMHRREMPAAYLEPWLREVRQLASWVESGHAAESVLLD